MGEILEERSVGNRRANYYLSCKLIKAVPKKNEKEEDGYQIFYPDGYVSWCPKSVFEDSYRDVTEFADSLLTKEVRKVFVFCYLQEGNPNLMKPVETVDRKLFDLTLDF